MSGFSITKRYTFESAHDLPWHLGKCHNLHGHSYILEVTVRGPIHEDRADDPEAGMVVDFASVSEVVKPVVAFLDHKYLNDIVGPNPTAERIVEWIVRAIRGPLGDLSGISLSRVRLFETATGWVDWEA